MENLKPKLKFVLDEIRENVIPVIVFLGISWAVMEILVNIANIFLPEVPRVVDIINVIAYWMSVVSIAGIALFGYLRYRLLSKIGVFLNLSLERFIEQFNPINEVWQKAADKHPVKQFIDWNDRTYQLGMTYLQEKRTNLVVAVSFISFVLSTMALFNLDDFYLLMHWFISTEGAEIPNSHTFLIDLGLVIPPIAGLLGLSFFAQVQSYLNDIKWKKNFYYHYAERAAKNATSDNEFDPLQAKAELCKFYGVPSVHDIHKLVQKWA